MKPKSILCFIFMVAMTLSLTGCGIKNFTSDSADNADLSDFSTSEANLPSSNSRPMEADAKLPEDYPADLVPVMDGAENIEVLSGMNYKFCSYNILDELENIASFHNGLFANEPDYADTSTDELYSIAFSLDGNGITITAEPNSSKDGYVLVSVTITQDQRD